MNITMPYVVFGLTLRVSAQTYLCFYRHAHVCVFTYKRHIIYLIMPACMHIYVGKVIGNLLLIYTHIY